MNRVCTPIFIDVSMCVLVVLTGASAHVHVCLQNCVPQEIDRQAYKEIYVDVEL